MAKLKFNKKGDEGTNSTIIEVGTLVLVIIIVIFILLGGPGKAFTNIFSSGDGKETKSSFTSLTVAVEGSLETGKTNLVPFFIENKYALVFFKEKEQRAGDFVAPIDCALLNCLAVCEKKDCRVLSFKVYGENYQKYTFNTNTKDGILIPLGQQGIKSLYIFYDSTKNVLSINTETPEIKAQYEQAIKK